MANADKTVANLVGSEIRQVNDYRRASGLPKQGKIEYRVSNEDLLTEASDYAEEDGDFTAVPAQKPEPLI